MPRKIFDHTVKIGCQHRTSLAAIDGSRARTDFGQRSEMMIVHTLQRTSPTQETNHHAHGRLLFSHAAPKAVNAKPPMTAARAIDFSCAFSRESTKYLSGNMVGTWFSPFSRPNLSTSDKCNAWRFVSCAICSLQLKPSAMMMVDTGALRTSGNSDRSPQAIETPYLSFS